MEITEMTIGNYEAAISLWQITDGIGLCKDVDTQERIAMHLHRNPGFSFVVLDKGKVVGAVLCGHDGRRGYLYHLAVAQNYRSKGIGKVLVEKALSKLRLIGIRRCHIFVFTNNLNAQGFWKHNGWNERADLKIMSADIVL